MTPPPAVQSRFADWRFATKAILGFWFFYALTVVARAFLGSDPWTALENKLAIIGIGIILTGLIYAAIATLGHGGPLRRKAVIAAIALCRDFTDHGRRADPRRRTCFARAASSSATRRARASRSSRRASRYGSSGLPRNRWS